MTRYIDVDKLEKEMYHEAFETDSDMQKWDSGCWIRYKLFENCIEHQPTADVVEVVRCKDCIHYEQNPWNREEKVCKCWAEWIPTDETDFCSYGKKIESEV